MNRVALTFDDGPGPETADLVRFLVDEQAAATFFVLGQNCELRPEVVTMMRDAPGIELATHSYSHPDLHHLDDEEIRDELERSNCLVTEPGGQTPPLFRPPYGHRDRRVDGIARELGQSVALWSLNSMDSKDDHHTTEHVLRNVRPGDVILFHDTHHATVTATRELVPALRSRGFELVTMSELLGPCVPGRVYRGRNGARVRLSRWLQLQVLRVRHRARTLRARPPR